MNRNQRFEFRVAPEEAERLRRLAQRADRSPSDLLRALVRQLDPATVSSGLPLLRPSEAEALEREPTAA